MTPQQVPAELVDMLPAGVPVECLAAILTRYNGIRNQVRQGEMNHQSRLSAMQVSQIRRLYGAARGRGKPPPVGLPTYRQLSVRYGVSPTTIRDIVVGRTWTHQGEGINSEPA